MKITIIGTGYVGLVSGACLADVGNDVLCLDLDAAKVAQLQQGQIPIHEPGLQALVVRNSAAGRLRFTTDAQQAAEFGMVQFIAVGTPADEDGSADLQHVLAAASTLGRHMTDYKVVVNKSTVPVGTADRVREHIQRSLDERSVNVPFSVVSNPEFLKEGAAVDDFNRPDRIVIGADDERAIQVMRAVYAPFQRFKQRMFIMDVRSAELTKYAANAMLATRISFMNELANLADAVGADIEWVRQGIGADERIGPYFLYAGCGYGGSCFPKDVRALLHTAQQEAALPLRVVQAVQEANEAQKAVLAKKIQARLGADLSGRHLALWGLAFKPNTDDMREAPSLTLIETLLDAGATVTAYDPVANAQARMSLGARLQRGAVRLVDSPHHALEGADALVIVTEWKEFRSPDFERVVATLKQPLIFDGRNLFDPVALAERGIEYIGIGRATRAR